MMVITLERAFAVRRVVMRPFVDALEAQYEHPKAKT